MSSLLPDILRALVSTTMNVLLMLSLLQPKYGKKVTALTMLGVLTADLGTAIFCYVSGNLTLLAKIDTVLFAVLCFAVRPFFKDSFMQWLFSYLTVQNISDIVIILSFIISRHLPYPAYANSVLRLLLFGSILFVIYRYVHPLYRQMVEHWTAYFSVALSVYLAFTCYVIFSDDIVNMLTTQQGPLILIILITVTSYISIGHSLNNLSREYALREEYNTIRAQETLLQKELAAHNEFVEQAKQNRHDLRHHNALLLEYLSRDDSAGAKEYLRQYDDELKDAALTEYCKNTLVNAVLRRCAWRAERAGVVFTVRADIPEALPLTPPELGVLISNLLENACEACEKADMPAPFILLMAETEGERLKIETRNTVGGKTLFYENGLPKSTKPGGGTGTRSMERIVKKYGGMQVFRQSQNTFITQIILPLVY